MSDRLCCVSVIGLCYILCILQHFVQGGPFFPDTVQYDVANYFGEYISPKLFSRFDNIPECIGWAERRTSNAVYTCSLIHGGTIKMLKLQFVESNALGLILSLTLRSSSSYLFSDNTSSLQYHKKPYNRRAAREALQLTMIV